MGRNMGGSGVGNVSLRDYCWLPPGPLSPIAQLRIWRAERVELEVMPPGSGCMGAEDCERCSEQNCTPRFRRPSSRKFDGKWWRRRAGRAKCRELTYPCRDSVCGTG